MKVQTTWFQKISLICGSVIAFLCILEVLLSGISLITKKNPENKKSDSPTLTIVSLGESTTAWGGETSYPQQLTSILNQKNPQQRVQVINLGIPGTSTKEIKNNIDNIIKDYQPQVVTMMMGVNDFWANEEVPSSFWIENIRKWGKVSKVAKLVSIVSTNLIYQNKAITKQNGPKLTQNWIELAKNALEKNDSEMAVSYLEKMFKEDPRAQSYFHAGLIFEEKYQQQGKVPRLINQALKYYLLAHEHEQFQSEKTGASLHAALIYQNLNNKDEAKKYFSLATKNPVWKNTPRAHFYMGDFYEKSEDVSSALEAYRLATQIRGEGMEVYWNWLSYKAMLRIYAKTENKNRFLEILKLAYQAYPNHFTLQTQLQNPEKLMKELQLNRVSPDFETGPANFYSLPAVVNNYQYVIQKLLAKNILPVVVSYAMRDLTPLKNALPMSIARQVLWVENKSVFTSKQSELGYEALFNDRFATDFGHATPLGNRLIALNIAQGLEMRLAGLIAQVQK